MQAILLAAGFGSRLRPLTDHLPKSLTEINGTPLIINALSILANNGVNETIIVIGHMREKIIERIGFEVNGMKITYVENVIYHNTNNIYSLYLTKDYIIDDVLLLECDLFYNDELIKSILRGSASCNILVSAYNSDTMEGTVIKVDKENNALNLIVKKQQGSEFDFTDMKKTVNIYKFSKEFMALKYMPAIELYVKTQNVNSYYELVLGSLIYYGNDNIKVVEVDESEWSEVDDLRDLKIAEDKFKTKL